MPYIPPSSSISSSPSSSTSSPSSSSLAKNQHRAKAVSSSAGPTPTSTFHARHHSEPSSIVLPSYIPKDARISPSTSYLRRHRRSPSLCAQLSLPSSVDNKVPATRHRTKTVIPGQRDACKSTVAGDSSNGNINTNSNNTVLIPTGAVLSPPESRHNSSDEEEKKLATKGKRMMAELQAAMQSIDQKTQHGDSSHTPSAAHKLVINPTVTRLPLSNPTDGVMLCNGSEIATQTPDQSDEDEIIPKPPMLRKKSGELVRPALRLSRRRPSSMPGTPTFSKAVHFGAQLEEVRHFMQLDRPLAVSAGSSPVEEYDGDSEFPFGMDHHTEAAPPPFNWEAKIINFPSDSDHNRESSPVRLERIFLSSDNKRLVGVVAVSNLAFRKHVVARFTLDYWKTISEVVAEYNDDSNQKLTTTDGYDQFYFNIVLADQPSLENKRMLICVRYSVDGLEFWDNNNSMNYHVEFSKKYTFSRKSRVVDKTPLARTLSLPPTIDPLDLGIPRDATDSMDFSPDPSVRTEILVPDSPTRRTRAPGHAFGERYDFSASLCAARQPGIPEPRKSSSAISKPTTVEGHQYEKRENTQPVEEADFEPMRLTGYFSDKPNHQSPGYKELVDKYCFVSAPKFFFRNGYK